MAKQNIGVSAGIIPWYYNEDTKTTYFLMGHPSNKPNDYWLYMRGMAESWENIMETALREFEEESGIDISAYKSRLTFMGNIQQREGKSVVAYGLHVTEDMFETLKPFITEEMHSNMCCGGTIPEIDAYQWMSFEDVVRYTHPTNIPFYCDIVRTAKI